MTSSFRLYVYMAHKLFLKHLAGVLPFLLGVKLSVVKPLICF